MIDRAEILVPIHPQVREESIDRHQAARQWLGRALAEDLLPGSVSQIGVTPSERCASDPRSLALTRTAIDETPVVANLCPRITILVSSIFDVDQGGIALTSIGCWSTLLLY